MAFRRSPDLDKFARDMLEFDKARSKMVKRLMIEGRVQGVGYRVSFADKAVALGLSGWVRNRRDGAVEACIDGEVAAIEAIVAWARQGPSGASVHHVAIEDAGDPASVDGAFKILPTQ